MEYLSLAYPIIASVFVAAHPFDTSADFTTIGLYKARATSEDHFVVPNNGMFFNPNPLASPIERICIASDQPFCAFGAEDGTWIAVYNYTTWGCVDVSPPLVLNNGVCCVDLDDCALLDQPPWKARDSPTSHATVVEIFGGSFKEGFPYYVAVENNGPEVAFNPAADLLNQVCMKTASAASCGFAGHDGTWVQVYNDTDNGCSKVSPPGVLNSVICCTNDNCPALHNRNVLRSRDIADAAKPKSPVSSSTTVLDLSTSNDSEPMTVPVNGSTFSFSTNIQISQICVSDNTMGCIFQAEDGIGYTVYTFDSGDGGCVHIDPAKRMITGFCCQDFYHCGTFNLPPKVRNGERDYSSHSLQNRGPVINNTLEILYEGSPNLVGWELVYTNLQGFNVTDQVPWAVSQICLMSNTALCAFVGQDGTYTTVIGGQNANCAIVGPPQILIDGVCCNSYTQCNASAQQAIARLAGPTVLAAYMGTNATSTMIVSFNTSVTASTNSITPREADTNDVTVQYFGAGGAYFFELVTGNYIPFSAPDWGVDQVCIITPQGFCGFWDSAGIMGFEVGPVAAGQSGACYTVGDAYEIAYGICCRSEDGCYSKRSADSIPTRDTANIEPVTRQITFYGDPAFYTAAGGVTTVLEVIANGHNEPIVAMGQPIVKVCVDSDGSCQFWEGDAFGPFIFGGNGGCLEFNPSITLTSVACL